jgi:DNA-binding IclR family transcriptional regulator
LGVGVSGVALSASLEREESEELVRGNAARLEVMGERVEDVIARVEVARREGVAHAAMGLMLGTSAVAVPVLTERGEALGAITVTAMAE